jgi:hypothetical protein
MMRDLQFAGFLASSTVLYPPVLHFCTASAMTAPNKDKYYG